MTFPAVCRSEANIPVLRRELENNEVWSSFLKKIAYGAIDKKLTIV